MGVALKLLSLRHKNAPTQTFGYPMNCPNCKKDFKHNADKPIVVMGVPSLDSNVHHSLLAQWDHILHNYRGLLMVTECTYVDMSRNSIVKDGIAKCDSMYGAYPDYFLFVDTDSVIGKRDPTGQTTIHMYPQYLDELIARNVDIVSGAYVRKKDAYAQVPVYGHGTPSKNFIYQVPENGLLEVDWFGGGYLLVKGEVFKKVDGPWFENRNDGFGTKGARTVGEDIYFCEKMRKFGYTLHLDLNVKIGHHGSVAWPAD